MGDESSFPAHWLKDKLSCLPSHRHEHGYSQRAQYRHQDRYHEEACPQARVSRKPSWTVTGARVGSLDGMYSDCTGWGRNDHFLGPGRSERWEEHPAALLLLVPNPNPNPAALLLLATLGLEFGSPCCTASLGARRSGGWLLTVRQASRSSFLATHLVSPNALS